MMRNGYGLRDKKSHELVGFSIESNGDADFCNSERCTLEFNGEENIWIAKSKLQASFARVTSTEWYNASYEHPINPINADTLEVVEIKISDTLVEPDYIPTFAEYMQMKYNTKGKRFYDPNHYQYVMGEYNKGKKIASPSLFEIQEVMENQS